MLKKGQWSEPTWHIAAMSYEETSKAIDTWLQEHDVETFTNAWHSVSFDMRFFNKYIKSEYDWSDTYCTLSVLRKNKALLGADGYSLAELRKVAGVEDHDTKKAHTALQDAYDAYKGYMCLTSKGLKDTRNA